LQCFYRAGSLKEETRVSKGHPGRIWNVTQKDPLQPSGSWVDFRPWGPGNQNGKNEGVFTMITTSRKRWFKLFSIFQCFLDGTGCLDWMQPAGCA
jgi:hypothetical protein